MAQVIENACEVYWAMLDFSGTSSFEDFMEEWHIMRKNADRVVDQNPKSG